MGWYNITSAVLVWCSSLGICEVCRFGWFDFDFCVLVQDGCAFLISLFCGGWYNIDLCYECGFRGLIVWFLLVVGLVSELLVGTVLVAGLAGSWVGGCFVMWVRMCGFGGLGVLRVSMVWVGVAFVFCFLVCDSSVGGWCGCGFVSGCVSVMQILRICMWFLEVFGHLG